MKKQSFILALALIAFVAIGSLSVTNSPNQAIASDNAVEQLPPNVIGHFVQGGNHVVYENKLSKKFKYGGNITDFKIVNLATGWSLVRAGILDGNKRSEAIPISLSNGMFKFIEPVWFTTCFAPDCEGFCRPNMANNGCICTGINGQNDCTFGNPPYELFEVDVLYP